MIPHLSHKPYLLDGPIMSNPDRIRLMVERMARCLVEKDAFHDPKQAMRELMLAGFPAFLVMRKLDDARQAAMQGVVAELMGES